MPKPKTFIIDEPCERLPILTDREVSKLIYDYDPTDLARIVLHQDLIKWISVVFSYVDRVIEPDATAILGVFLIDLYAIADGCAIRSYYPKEEILRTFNGHSWNLVQRSRLDEAANSCRHNIDVMFEVISSPGDNYYRPDKILIGVCAPTPQDLWRYEDDQICCGIEEFVEDYFRRHPDKFPLGDFNELVLLGSL